jgi:bleomycin hydrolase
MLTLSFLLVTLLVPGAALSQSDKRDKALMGDPKKNEFMEKITAESEKFRKKDKPVKKEIRPDFSTFDAPSKGDFSSLWHTEPVSQGNSGMCWCFATTSFFESEVHRLTGKSVKLSELYTVYWEYVDKARRYVRERGNSTFGQGSEANAVVRVWRAHGIVPQSAYSGLKPGQVYHDHDAMFNEMHGYLQSLKASNAWNEEGAVATIRSILDRYLGEPPAEVAGDHGSLTPQDYLRKELKITLDDYVDILSLMAKPYYQKAEYEVPDNWWHNADYHNVPLDDFMALVRKAVRDGYTLSIGGDTSESGLEGHAGIAVVPSYDIPSAFIDESARQFRFSNGTTTDDHLIHITGVASKNGKDWFLIKDSGSGARNNGHPGYYFFHEDYVKLKIMTLFVHKDAARGLLGKFSQ